MDFGFPGGFLFKPPKKGFPREKTQPGIFGLFATSPTALHGSVGPLGWKAASCQEHPPEDSVVFQPGLVVK